MKLLSEASSNAKTAKNKRFKRYLSYILHLAPSDLSGTNVCPRASAGCIATCLNTAGRGVFSTVQAARIRKTQLFVHQRDEFMNQLHSDLCAVVRKAAKLKRKAVVRLNGTSDLDWISLIRMYPEIQFYDYTKVLSRLKRELPANYDLTFSRSETNETDCLEALKLGFNVAVVFDAIPNRWHDKPVTDGDSHDLRFLDQVKTRSPHWIGLTSKGKAKRDTSGFVVRIGAS